ncbi:MAG TPA: hypothetical protein DCO89_00985, partial [Clostridiales bacterium]|nr:hypothetical protein [Clostridiales bacterium]
MISAKKLYKKLLSTSAVLVAPLFVCTGVNTYNAIKNGKNLNLLTPGVHLRAGEHKVVFTEDFWNVVKKDTDEKDFKIVLSGIKEAYKTLNELNTGVKFNVCTNCDYFVNYGIEKTNSYGNQDILLNAFENG